MNIFKNKHFSCLASKCALILKDHLKLIGLNCLSCFAHFYCIQIFSVHILVLSTSLVTFAMFCLHWFRHQLYFCRTSHLLIQYLLLIVQILPKVICECLIEIAAFIHFFIVSLYYYPLRIFTKMSLKSYLNKCLNRKIYYLLIMNVIE